jgi:hypothetical protein
MAQFAQAQNSFLANFGDEMDEAMSSDEDMVIDNPELDDLISERNEMYPTGDCIVCQGKMDENSAQYGMLSFLQETNLLRYVDFQDKNVLMSIIKSDLSLDVEYKQSDTEEITDNETGTSQYFKLGCHFGSCRHLMHVSCFEEYNASIRRRHLDQPGRNHPEVRSENEFLCPLCKSIGNSLVPIIWSDRKETINWKGCKLPLNISNQDDRLFNIFKGRIAIDEPAGDNSSLDSLVTFTEDCILKKRNLLNISDDHFINLLFSSMPALQKKFNLTASSIPGNYPDTLNSVKKFYYSHFHANIKRIHKISGGIHVSNLAVSEALFETFSTSLCAMEIGCRGVVPSWIPSGSKSRLDPYILNIGILDTITRSSLESIKILSETCISSLLLTENLSSFDLISKCDGFLFQMVGDGSSESTPLLLKDGFEHIVTVAMLISPCFQLPKEQIFYYIRFFALFEGLFFDLQKWQDALYPS